MPESGAIRPTGSELEPAVEQDEIIAAFGPAEGLPEQDRVQID
jgi:hypothetical protein